MRWLVARLAAGVLLAVCAPPGAWAAAVPGAQVIGLSEAVSEVDPGARTRVWIDTRGDATIEQVSRARGGPDFRPADPDTIHRLGKDAVLWMHLRLHRSRDARHDWAIELPLPVLDRVTVYQREGPIWWANHAGDTIPTAHWAEPGRYPFFRLDLPPGETRDVYLRIRHTTPSSFPVHLTTTANHTNHVQVEYLTLGVALGALLLLVAGCIAQSWAYRDPAFAWYGVYALLTSLAVGSYTGAAAHLLWPRFGALQDAPMPMLACIAVAAAMLFVRNILGLRRRFALQDRAMLVLAGLGMALALLPPFGPKLVALPVVGAYMVVATLAALAVSLAAWARGDTVGKWVFAAYLPMVVAVLFSVFRIFGWIGVSFGSQYAVVGAMAVEVPLLLVALFIRSRDRHSAEIREQALSTHDALTGLLAPHLFHDRLRQVVARYRRDGESAAVMFIDLVNHGRIHAVFGTAVAEQSLLRSVIKLRRLLRDVDTVSRVGEARFGVILEGASARSSVTERATRLIAAGLMPLPGLKPDVTLQFHVAALILGERPLEADEIQQALAERLATMSGRTRRPIRFVEPGQPASSEPGESSLFAADADADAAPASSGLASRPSRTSSPP